MNLGQERFSVMTASYYRGAQGALLVYDVGNRDSFEHVKQWYDRARQLGGEDLEVLLVGNKSDIAVPQIEVPTEEGAALAGELGIGFIEASALSGDNVEGAFVQMTAAIKKSVDRRGLTGVKTDKLNKTGTIQLAYSDQKMSFTQMYGCGII
jgi:GTPase SAR1 family protein